MFVSLLFSYSIFAQQKLFKGIVSEGNSPLPGVSVVIYGTDIGTQTDLEGHFSLSVSEGDILVISFIGMQEVKYKVSKENTARIQMSTLSQELEEVVVMAYGEIQKKSEIVGNVVSLKGDVLAKTPVVSVDQALQGRISGLQISGRSGTPGSVQNIRIRGRNSLSATNEPLYVIDGVPIVTGDIAGSSTGSSLSKIAGLNSEDIQTISILKDAAATSTYGARGSNGVIIITTKSGVTGKTKFNFSTSVGFQNPARKGPEFLSGKQKKELWLEAVYNTYGKSGGFGKDQTWEWFKNRSGPNNILVKWVEDGEKVNNWKKAVQNKDAIYSKINFSASARDNVGGFYASIGHEKSEGTVIGSDFRKIVATFNTDRKISDMFYFRLNNNIYNLKQDGILEGGAYFSNPNLTGMFMSPWHNIYNKDGSLNMGKSPSNLPNTLYITKNNLNRNDVINVRSINTLGAKIVENLLFESSLGIDYYIANYKSYENPILGDGEAYKGAASDRDNKNFNYVWTNKLDYNFYINEMHSIKTLAVIEFQKNKNNFLRARGEVLPPGMQTIGSAAANFTASSNYFDWSQLSFLTKVDYLFDKRYSALYSVRREGTTRFSERWGTFQAIGVGWNINNESFMNNIDFINYLRLKSSYGTTGNSSISTNVFQQLLAPTTNGGEAGLYAYQVGGNLKWETQNKFDISLEFALLKNRISGSIGYYSSKTKDLLYNLPLSRTTGFSSQMVNLGSISNNGIELELNFDIIQGKDFNWSIGGNFATSKSKVNELPYLKNGDKLEVLGGYNALKEGKLIYEWYMPSWAGVNTETGAPEWYKADGTKTSVYSQAEKRFQGSSPLPKVSGGINTAIDFKGFFASALFTFSAGYKIYDSWARYTQGINSRTLNTYNGTTELLNRWKNPGDNTDVPKLTASSGMEEYTAPSTRFLYNGDHIRLRQLVLGYNFDQRIAKRFGLEGIGLSLTGMNLFTWVKDKKLKGDPEVGVNGFIEMATPTIKSITFSLNVNF